MNRVIVEIPMDRNRRKQLINKLAEYKKRYQPYCAPDLQMDVICKIAVLEAILLDNRVNTWDLSRKMQRKYGSAFTLTVFNNACAVIDDYCQTGGKRVTGGGLPN